MLRTSDDTMTLKRKKSLWPLLWICLIGFAISSCAGAPKFPTKDVWETNIKFDVCRQYEIYDFVNFKFKHVKDWPLNKCNGVFGFSTPDVPMIFDWGYDMQEYVQKKCK